MGRALRVVVVGGGIGGLASALFLARRGHRVQVYERDGAAAPETATAAGLWWRRGTPQSTHSHAFPAACREVLLAEAPDVLRDLLDAGVREVRLTDAPPSTLDSAPPAEDRLTVLAGRRTVLEWVLRRAAGAEPGITLRTGAGVAGLWLEPMCWDPVRVMGVRLDSGQEVAADLVVDAAGRRSPVPGWLADAGAVLPAERTVACGITYYTRFYHRGGAADPGPLDRGHLAGGSFDRYSCQVFPADNGVFSVTFGVLPDDLGLRPLHDGAAFDAAAAAVPASAPWVDPRISYPMARVTAMAGLTNRMCGLVRDGTPAALGVLAVGDSVCGTDPAHTRGTALALRTAARLAAVVDAHPGDPHARALAMEQARVADLEPWFDDSVARDRDRLARWRSAPVPPGPSGWVSNAAANLAAQRDPVVWSAVTALRNLLARPAEVLGDAAVAARVRAVVESDWRPPPPVAPEHDELAAIVAAAVGLPGTGTGTASAGTATASAGTGGLAVSG